MKFSTLFLIMFLALWPALSMAEDRPSVNSSFTWRDAQPSADSELDRLNRAFVELADHARPAIVQIRVTTQDTKAKRAQPLGSRGSGFIIDSHGYILTAQHVIDYASAKTSNTARYARFFWNMLARGVYLPPSQFETCFISLALDDGMLEETGKNIAVALRESLE